MDAVGAKSIDQVGGEQGGPVIGGKEVVENVHVDFGLRLEEK